MKKTNKFVAALSIAAISTLISSVAFAANGDMYERTDLTNIKYNSNDLAESAKLQRIVTMGEEDFGYEHNGKIYSFEEVNTLYMNKDCNINATLKALESNEIKEIATVEAPDKEAPVLVYDGAATIELKNGAEFTVPEVTAKDNKDEKVEVKHEIKNAEGKVIEAIDTKVAGTYTITYTAKDAAGNEAEAKVITVKVAEDKLAVESVSAIADKNVNVTFNREVEGLTRDSIIVKNSKGNKQLVKSVVYSEDKKTVQVEFYDSLVADETYTFAVALEDGTTVEGTLEFVVGQPTQIVIENQTVKAGTATAVKYNVLDENGLDITNKANVTFFSDKNVTTDGKVNLADKEYAFVEVTATKKDGTTVKSARVKVTGEAAKPVEVSNWTIGAENNFDKEDYKQDSTVAMGVNTKRFTVEVKDQFDKVFSGTVTYESLDPTVAVVDKTTGTITPRKTGTAAVKVTVTDSVDQTKKITKTVEITVVAKATATEIVTDKEAVTLITGTQANTADLSVKVKDQYGSTIANAPITASIKTGSDVVSIGSTTVTENKLTVTGKKAGSAVIEIKSGELTKVVNVTVKENGEVASYEVEGIKEVLDFNYSETTTDANYEANTMTLKVNPVDANGEVAGNPITDATITVKDSQGNDVPGASLNTITIGTKDAPVLKTGKAYTVTVKVKNLTVKTFTFKVEDTRRAPAVSFTANKITLNDSVINSAIFNTAFEGIMEIPTDWSIQDVDFVSSNTTIINDNDSISDGVETPGVTVGTSKEDTTSIYVDSITVKNTNTDEVFTIDLKSEKVDVTVDNVKPFIAFTKDADGEDTTTKNVVATDTDKNGKIDTITVVFSEDIDAKSVDKTKITNGSTALTTDDKNITVDGNTMTIKFDNELATTDTASTTISVSGIKDVAGNTMTTESSVAVIDKAAEIATLDAGSTSTSIILTLSGTANVTVVSPTTGATVSSSKITLTNEATNGTKVVFNVKDVANNEATYTATYNGNTWTIA